ncbi:MAG TPA: hypothetical protein VFX14_10150 [Methylomirabilota bacterium]|nr:hypothetical protein [Methylomirabilota bacterium]
MPSRRGRLVGALVLIAGSVIVAAPAGAVEEIVRMETTVVDCQDMLQGSLGCRRYIHAYTTINPNQTKAGRTFTVYTQAEIDERLQKVKTSMVDPAIQALAEEVAQLRRALSEVHAVCAEAPRPASD